MNEDMMQIGNDDDLPAWADEVESFDEENLKPEEELFMEEDDLPE